MRPVRLIFAGWLLLAWLPLALAGAPDDVDVDLLAAEIRALTVPELAGRGAGSPGELAAAELIAGWFESARLAPVWPDRWLQPVPLPPELGGGTSVNVVGQVPGRGDLASRWIILGAHLDHLGRVDPAATDTPAPGAYFPGAGDNAAGVAAMLHAARTLAAGVVDGADRSARRSLLVCAFGAEEIGLVGSAHLAAELPVAVDQVDAMVNLDAVGRLQDGPLHVAGLPSCAAFPALVADAAGGLPISSQTGSRLSSDHASFLARGIPSLFLFTGAYPEMNSPADSLALVDLAGLAAVAAATTRLVDRLCKFPGDLRFTQPEPPPPVDVQGDRRTWFGSVPDFATTGDSGYHIGGLADGGPAQQAGLQVGDRLVSLAGEPVTDLPTFTAAMRRHAPGEVVEVQVERQGRTLSFLVTLGDRAQRLR